MARVHAIREAGEDDGAGSEHVLVDCDRESSVFRTRLSLELRGSGTVNTMAACGDLSFAGSTLLLKTHVL